MLIFICFDVYQISCFVQTFKCSPLLHSCTVHCCGWAGTLNAASLQSVLMLLTHQSEGEVQGDAQDPSQTTPSLRSAVSFHSQNLKHCH